LPATVSSTERVADMVSMAVREAFTALRDRRTWRSRAMCSTARSTSPRPSFPNRQVSCVDALDRRPARHRELADILVNAERPPILYGQQVWTARGQNEAIALLRGSGYFPGYFNGASRGLLPPGDPHHFDRTRTQAFANADVL